MTFWSHNKGLRHTELYYKLLNVAHVMIKAFLILRDPFQSHSADGATMARPQMRATKSSPLFFHVL